MMKKVGNPSLRLLKKPTLRERVLRTERPEMALLIVFIMVYMDMKYKVVLAQAKKMQAAYETHKENYCDKQASN
jgi:hypothetical protein